MEFNIYQESSVWKDSRNERINSFIKIISYLMIVLALQWVIITLIQHIYILTIASLITSVCGIYALQLVRSNKIHHAKVLILITSISYYLFTCIFASGFGTNYGSAHFGFIALALLAFFLLYNNKIVRELVSISLLLLFFLFHFGYAIYYPLVTLPEEKLDFVHKMDITITLFVIFYITSRFVIEITKAEEALTYSADRLEGLIQSMLPKEIADRMRREGKTFADEFHECSVLFADIVDFTKWSETHSPNEMIERLNKIFSRFDEAVNKKKLTKIKISGDSYMVASGIPEYRKDHAEVLVELALELQMIANDNSDFKFRIGINSGSAVAGVIGKTNFIYDIWGDTVNIASRMESSGENGKVNISESTYKLVKNNFNFEYRGKIEAKHKGMIDMYFVNADHINK